MDQYDKSYYISVVYEQKKKFDHNSESQVRAYL